MEKTVKKQPVFLTEQEVRDAKRTDRIYTAFTLASACVGMPACLVGSVLWLPDKIKALPLVADRIVGNIDLVMVTGLSVGLPAVLGIMYIGDRCYAKSVAAFDRWYDDEKLRRSWKQYQKNVLSAKRFQQTIARNNKAIRQSREQRFET